MTRLAGKNISTHGTEKIKEMICPSIVSAGFECRARRPQDWQVKLVDWPETRYEIKANAAGRQCSFFLFSREA